VEHPGWYQVSLGMGKSFREEFRVDVRKNGRVVGALQGLVALSGSFMVAAAAAGDLFELYTDSLYLKGPDRVTAYSLSIVQLA
jgi:hypothetical protein